jgi:chromosome segregation ATPase
MAIVSNMEPRKRIHFRTRALAVPCGAQKQKRSVDISSITNPDKVTCIRCQGLIKRGKGYRERRIKQLKDEIDTLKDIWADALETIDEMEAELKELKDKSLWAKE